MAAMLALLVFFGLGFLILIGIATSLSSTQKTTISSNTVLFLDLSKTFSDRKTDKTIAQLTGGSDMSGTSLYELVRLINHAASDSAVRGIYIKCNDNANGFGASDEIRNALKQFKTSGKFIIAYGDMISQKAYYVANIADKVYGNPKGGLDWKGFASQMFFIKNTLKQLEVEPQIFYAGKFKSATEPLREEKMTEANRIQTSIWLNDLYKNLLLNTAEQRVNDTVMLKHCADSLLIQTTNEAVHYGLLDGAKYDDEVKTEIRSRLGVGKDDKINFVLPATYAEVINLNKYSKERIAVIYAEGDIVYGKGGTQGEVASDEFRQLLAKARTDKNVKAVVLRVNSPGGSALASEIIWRESELIKKEGKPFVVSMGDLAASGGYYISAAADSIFAQPNTLTGSIGVFTIVPNLQGFFKNKLGVTFDEVKTADHASYGTISKPLTELEKKILQRDIDTVYYDFKARVAEGRKKNMEEVEQIAQGRIWTGTMAQQVGLIDRLGGLQDAIDCAARMANLADYAIREYPEPKTLFDMLKSGYTKNIQTSAVKEELGSEGFQIFEQIKKIKQITGSIQARIPYDILVD